MSQSPPHRSVVIAVTSHQPDSVIRTAAWLARSLDVELVCAHVDTSAYVVEEHPDGTVEAHRWIRMPKSGSVPSSTPNWPHGSTGSWATRASRCGLSSWPARWRGPSRAWRSWFAPN